jgi:hypothetical protein
MSLEQTQQTIDRYFHVMSGGGYLAERYTADVTEVRCHTARSSHACVVGSPHPAGSVEAAGLSQRALRALPAHRHRHAMVCR